MTIRIQCGPIQRLRRGYLERFSLMNIKKNMWLVSDLGIETYVGDRGTRFSEVKDKE
jgi:hypothetical protein